MSTDLPITTRPIASAISNDTRALLLFEVNKTELFVTYILLFALGWLGAHNFYLQRTGIAIAQLILSITIIGLIVTLVWILVDVFLVPGIVKSKNNALATQLGA